MTLHKMYWCHG